MEKITLKPAVKELIYKNEEDNVHFDVLAYQGASGQEKMLGSLFVLGHIKYTEENLAYAVSLISSLAKREYYSERSFQEQNAKGAFERTLKKLNEVLDDFFQNKNFKLNIGLAAISGENIYISRLGKFKIALARDGKYIDILNNIDLFSKDAEGEKQFSNIISGRIQPNDKIFAYFPFRSVTSREKQLNDIFVKENQDGFSQKIAHLAANANNFSCCGVHIDMQKIKEIPISTAVYVKPTLKIRASSIKNERMEELETSPSKTQDTEQQDQPHNVHGHALRDQTNPEISESQDVQQDVKMSEISLETEQSRIIPAEFLISKRVNIFTPVISSFQKLISAGRLGLFSTSLGNSKLVLGERARRRGFVLISAVIIVPILVFILLKTGNDSNNQNAIKQAGENFKLAQSRVNQSNFKDARSLLQASLINLTSISDKKAENIRQQINQILDGLDRVNDKQPAFFTDLSAQNSEFTAKFISSSDGDSINAIDTAGLAFTATLNEISQLGQFGITPQFIFSTPSWISAFNGSDVFSVYDLKSKKVEQYSLKEPVPAVDAILYENNLYTLSNNTIYKYADATTGGTKRTTWTSDSVSGHLMSITADGNIYALNGDGKLITYFKGKKTGELDLQVIPSSGSRLFTYKDSAFIYLADKTNKRVYVFDKVNGSLKTAYKLDPAGTIQDIFISPDSTVWILSSDNKIWVIK